MGAEHPCRLMDLLGVSAALVADFFKHHAIRPATVVELEFLGAGRVRWVEQHASVYRFGDLEPAHQVGGVDELLAKVDALRSQAAAR